MRKQIIVKFIRLKDINIELEYKTSEIISVWGGTFKANVTEIIMYTKDL